MNNTIENGMELEVSEEKKEPLLTRGKVKAKQIFGKIGMRNIIVACSVLLIGAALVFNFVLFGNGSNAIPEAEADKTVNKTEEAQEDEYFASAVLSRKQARDEALSVLQTVVDSASADTAAKEQASADISRISAEIENEANVEALIKSKGFEECVAVIGQNSASIIVSSDGLLPNELSQIKEIVYEQAGVEPVNIKIIEKNT